MNTNSIDFTGLVVACNEANRLVACLESLAFCSEIIVVDLESRDESPEIAARHGARVIKHPRVPIVEKVREKALSYAGNRWVVLLDPDEVFPTDRINEIKQIILDFPDVALIKVPMRNYFRGKPLFTTPWGMRNTANRIVDKDRVVIVPNVHNPISVRDGSREITMDYRGEESVIKHYWIDSYSQMFEKHYRYLKHEGESRYKRGERFSWMEWYRGSLRASKRSLIKCNGIRGGVTGILLSIFYTLYISISLLSLRAYEKKIKKLKNIPG